MMIDMADPNIIGFNPGGIKDRFDSRDYQWDEVGGAISVPFDWSEGFDIEQELSTVLKIPNFKLTVKDQNGSYSCGGQAWSYLAEVLEALATGTYEPRSAKYLYAQTYVPSGGSRGRDNAEVYVNQGVARESALTSYKNGNPPDETFMERSVDITEAVRYNAKLAKASAYAQTGTGIESVAIAIRTNAGVVLGIDGSNNGTWDSEFPVPPTAIEWRHWVYCGKAKLINGKKFIGLINSWGKNVGVNGWQWIGEDYFKSNVWSGWTHVFAPVTSPVFSHNFQNNLKYKQTNQEVVALQDALRIDGEFPQSVQSTGYYGAITAKAVLAFQFKYGLITSASESDNGQSVGPKTRAKLNNLYY